MKIAIIDMDNLKNPFWGTGQSRATRQVGKRLASHHSITVYCSKYPGWKDYEEDGIKYIHVGLETNSPRLTNLAFMFNIPFLVRKIKADVIIENFNAPFSISFAPLFTRIPVIGLPTMFNAIEFSKKYHLPFHWIEWLGMKFYKYLLPYSEVDSAKARRLNPNIVYKIVPQGVGPEFFHIKPTRPKHVLYFGRLDIWQKGLDLLLEAYSLVADKIKYPLVIAGHGPDEPRIRQQIKDLGLESKVKLIGPIYGAKKAKIFSESLYNAFPSRHDEICLGTLEVLAAGLPVICFDLPESEWLTSKISLKAPRFDPKAYSKLLLKAMRPEIINPLRAATRPFARQYTWDKVATQIESFIKLIV